MINAIIQLYERDLNKLKNEIELYHDEETLWIITDGISNSAGNLCLHIIGNLKNFIGAILGNSGYVRNRPLEFSSKVVKTALISEIEETLKIVKQTLENLDIAILEKDYPEEVFGTKMRTDFFIIHLQGHLNYHLGQINYHRRILCYK
jgi:Protein of unknown function (DUF1572)